MTVGTLWGLFCSVHTGFDAIRSGRTSVRLARRRPAVLGLTIVVAVSLAAGSPVPLPARAAGDDVTGMFVDGWYPGAYAPARPMNADRDSMTAVVDLWDGWSAITMSAVSTTGEPMGATFLVESDSPPTAGHVDRVLLHVPWSGCGPEGHGEIHEVTYDASGAVESFAATTFTKCDSNPPSEWVQSELRYHSTLGFHGFAVTPLALAAYLRTPDLDLGDQRIGEAPVSGRFVVTNTGSLPLAVGAGPPADPAFQLVPGGCDGTPVPVSESCAITLAFAPEAAGRRTTELSLVTPDLGRAARTLIAAGRGVARPSIEVRIREMPIDWQWDGNTLWEASWAPSDYRGWLEIETTCGGRAEAALVPVLFPSLTAPLLTVGSPDVRRLLPAGPCTATWHAYSDPDWGFDPVGPSTVDFVVPSYAELGVYPVDGVWYRPDEPIVMAGSVGALNGLAPDGGLLTIDDESTGERLHSQVISAADNGVEARIGPLGVGPHVIRVAYSGDANVRPRIARYPFTVDGAPPDGSAEIEDGAAFTASSKVRIALTATDDSSGVATARVANAADLVDHQLTAGTDVTPTGPVAWSLVPGDGVRHVFVQWRDVAGNWSQPVRRSIVVDSAAPVVGRPTTSFAARTRIGTGTAPLRVAFSVHDAGAGVATSRLQVSRDGGSWTDAGPGNARNLQLVPGHSYRFRGAATDRAGNLHIGAASAAVRLAIAQESASSVARHGTWTSRAMAGSSGGRVIWSRAAGASVSYGFTGKAVAWIAPVGPTRGRAYVYIDGRYAATVSQRRTDAEAPQVVFSRSWSAVAWHRVQIVVVGGSLAARIDVDAFATLR